MNPLKQGLKHNVPHYIGERNEKVKEVNPLKQGLKPFLFPIAPNGAWMLKKWIH